MGPSNRLLERECSQCRTDTIIRFIISFFCLFYNFLTILNIEKLNHREIR